MTTESDPQRITFYQIPPSVLAYRWTGQSVGVVQRRSLDSQGHELMLHGKPPHKGDWIVEARYDGSVLYAASDEWLRKFYEDRPVREVIKEIPCTVHTCGRHDSGD